MSVAVADIRKRLIARDFSGLFIEDLGWDRVPTTPISAVVDNVAYQMHPVAQKRGAVACVAEVLPDRLVRSRLERALAKIHLEHILVFADPGSDVQVWQWARREPGKPASLKEHWLHRGQTGERLAERLVGLAVSLAEEPALTLPGVTARMRRSFDADRVTRAFYERFKKEHDAFLGFIEGISELESREWYASVMLNRLMFTYFIQKKGFLDRDPDYLRNRLARVSSIDSGRFLTFYRYFLLHMFHGALGGQGLPSDARLESMIGDVPYINGGLFAVHELERRFPEIDIPDAAFERVFDFFDAYTWHLDDRPLRSDREINPDVLGYIFEKYINQKELGAYYTKEDITRYMAAEAVIPEVLRRAASDCSIAFRRDGAVWHLLREDPERYISDVLLYGFNRPVPPDIASGISDPSDRRRWNELAGEGYGLVHETWREVLRRRQAAGELRQRLEQGLVTDIDQLIGANLDLVQFVQDVIDTSEGPELLRALYKGLADIRVLDPACGSGAFLFATLTLLEPLCQSCLDRMKSFLDDPGAIGAAGLTDFADELRRLSNHSDHRSYLLKSIIARNLFGVDIVEEAVEICKLRLFLKVVAHMGDSAHIEPLPDIDFNIRAGNSLVGFATAGEIVQGMASTLDLHSVVAGLLRRSQEVADRLSAYRESQLAVPNEEADTVISRDDLLETTRALATDLSGFLATMYGVDPHDELAFKEWRDSHLPFHWFAEFYETMEAGGFDVVIGNPPFVELSKVRGYVTLGYLTQGTGNLYALFVERCSALLRPGGRLAFIVPLSGFSTHRMRSYQQHLADAYASLHISYYSGDAHPSILFEGVKYRLAIVLGRRMSGGEMSAGTTSEVFTSSYRRWYADERATLFETLHYEKRPPSAGHLIYAKTGDVTANEVLASLTSVRPVLGTLLRNHGERLTYHRSPVFWIRAMDFEPYFSSATRTRSLDHLRDLYLPTRELAWAIGAVLNSTLFYFWFIAQGNCRDIAGPDIEGMPIGELSPSTLSTLGQAFGRLMADLKVHSRRRVYTYRRSGIVEYDEFYPSKSKPLIDSIDQILATHYGLSAEQTDYLLNFDIKYRMGSALSGDATTLDDPE